MRNLLIAIGVLMFAVVAAPTDAAAGDWHGHGHGWGGHGNWHHGGGTHVVVGVGPGWGWGWRPGFYVGGPWYGYGPYPYPYAYPYGYAAPPVVVQQQQPVYVQRDAPAYSDEDAPDSRRNDDNWYYCESQHGYYPDVKTCPEDWIAVPPRN
jgi:hypothetical protein